MAAAPAAAAAGGAVKKLDMAKIGEAKKADVVVDEATIVFHLPDGKTQHTDNFRIGWTVGYLKLQLNTKFDFQYDRQELFLGDNNAAGAANAATTTGTLATVSAGKSSMADPMTLSDYQIKPKHTAHIFVKLLTDAELAQKQKDEEADD